MSRSKKDQRGGHRRRKSNTYSCGCCEILTPTYQSHNRTERERESMRHEMSATHHSPQHHVVWGRETN